MFGMNILDELRPFHLPIDFVVKNRYRIMRKESVWLDQTTYIVSDEEHQEECLLKTIDMEIDDGERGEMYVRIMDLCKYVKGFPRLLEKFEYKSYGVIVTSIHGEDFQNLIRRGALKVTSENGVRMAHRLFGLIDELHQKGYVHRNINLTTIRGGFDWNGEFTLELHGHLYATPIKSGPSPFGMQEWHLQSLAVNEGRQYTIVDDYIASVFSVLSAQVKNLFIATPRKSMIQQKRDFHYNPEKYLANPDLNWITNLYGELCRQQEKGFDKKKITSLLNAAIPGCSPSSRFDWSYMPSRKRSSKIAQLDLKPNKEDLHSLNPTTKYSR